MFVKIKSENRVFVEVFPTLIATVTAVAILRGSGFITDIGEMLKSVLGLNGDMVEYEEYKKMNDENKQLNDLFGDSVVEIGSENLPF